MNLKKNTGYLVFHNFFVKFIALFRMATFFSVGVGNSNKNGITYTICNTKALIKNKTEPLSVPTINQTRSHISSLEGNPGAFFHRELCALLSWERGHGDNLTEHSLVQKNIHIHRSSRIYSNGQSHTRWVVHRQSKPDACVRRGPQPSGQQSAAPHRHVIYVY